MSKPAIVNAKLTKSFFMALNEGVFLESGVGGPTPFDSRSFEEYVVPNDQRAAKWTQIKEVRADQRNCSVFASKEDDQEWQKGWNRNVDGRGWYRDGPAKQ